MRFQISNFRVHICVFCVLCASAVSLLLAETPEDLFSSAQQLEKQGSAQRAIEQYRDFLAKYKDHALAVESRYRLARCYDAVGSSDKAIVELEAVCKADSRAFKSKPERMYLLGKLQAGEKNYAAAVDAFEKLLTEGAGPLREEVLNSCAGFYVLLNKYDQAAAKYRTLAESPEHAEASLYKLTLLWLKAENLDRAITALADLARRFPNNRQIPELLLKTAQTSLKLKDADKMISLCEQLRRTYPRTVEAAAGNYLLGLSYREKKEFPKALEVLEQVGALKDPQARGLAAEALVQAANIYMFDLSDTAKAIPKYEEASKLARLRE